MINILNSSIWSVVIVFLIVISFIYIKKLKFLNLQFCKLLSPLKNKDNLLALSISLGGKIGVGSLSGIAIAIVYGGVGVIFWIWLCSLLTSIISYVETYYGALYKKNNVSGTFCYLKYGLNNKFLAFAYAFLLLITFVIGFNSIQVNTIIKCFEEIEYIKIILMILFTYIIFRGKEIVSKISSLIVPFMMILYIIIGVYIIVINFNLIPIIFKDIYQNIFNKKTFLSGLIIGIQRAIFATEIGTGTSSIVTSSSNDTPNNQGLSQMFGVYFISFIICTLTYFIIVSSDYNTISLIDLNGIEIVSHAFNYHLRERGKIFLKIITFMFSFSTIISSYYYGEISLKFLTKVNKFKSFLYKVIILIFIYLSMNIKASYIWNLVDIFLGILSIINIYALYKLRKIDINKINNHNLN